MKFYLSFCKHCGKKTKHFISSICRSRGVRLKCLDCRHQKHNYINFKNLVEGEFKPTLLNQEKVK